MSNDQTFKQILVGSAVTIIGAIAGAIATALINLIVAGKINTNYWWIWVIGGLIGAFLLFKFYQINKFPYKKWRVTNVADGKGLLADATRGKPVEENAWLFKECTVYGPYLRQSLLKGKYKVTFRLKVVDLDATSNANNRILEINVAAARAGIAGDKLLALHALTTFDFSTANVYENFSLLFDIYKEEQQVEFRVCSEYTSHTIVLDYVRFSTRLY
jgi:MFS family permease